MSDATTTPNDQERSIDVDGLRSRARWTQIALIAVVIVDLVAVGSDFAEYRLLGSDYTIEEADANDTRQAAIGGIQFLLLVATAVFFIRWFKRAYENVNALDRPRRYRIGWSIWGWFVPILNLWRPKQIANDIWRSTNPDPNDEAIHPLLTLWWAAFLLTNWASQGAFRAALAGDTPEELRLAALVYMVADSLDVVAAVLAIWVVRSLTARQAGRAQQAMPSVAVEPSPRLGTSES